MGHAAVPEHILPGLSPRNERKRGGQRSLARLTGGEKSHAASTKERAYSVPVVEKATAGSHGMGSRLPPYLHCDAEVHHGDTGVAVPAHVHHRVATVRGLALQ